AAVEKMIARWDKLLAPILPDQPDLIVIPEACDRYLNHTIAQRQDYYRQRGTQVSDFFPSVAPQNACYITPPAPWPMPDGSWRTSVELLGRDGSSVGIY